MTKQEKEKKIDQLRADIGMHAIEFNMLMRLSESFLGTNMSNKRKQQVVKWFDRAEKLQKTVAQKAKKVKSLQVQIGG